MCFYEADILLPKFANNPELMKKWSVIACDQYTSDQSYWNKTKDFAGNEMSVFNLIFPEIYLETESEEQKNNRIKNIVESMKSYEKDLICYQDSMFYIERTLKNRKIRRGLIGTIDLEEYDYKKDSKSKIRSTEETVASRIPPRIKIRENALLELPHVMILYNDENNSLISMLRQNLYSFEKVYDFDLMQDSGNITGYNLDKKNIDFVKNFFCKANNNGFEFAVGDGNHSLATAKECWENIKKTDVNYSNHPARYALAEIVNIYDESLEFEPIYRILFDTDPRDVINNMENFMDISEEIPFHKNYQEFEIYYGENHKKLYLNNPKFSLFVKNLQVFLDHYLHGHIGKIDYIHGKSETIELAKKNHSIGFIFDTMKKSDLFPTIEKDGVLPRKTFSMGEADDKRFYTECRKIK